ncbi:MAG: flavin reductase family protein [Deltaproteobacteria bacterium]
MDDHSKKTALRLFGYGVYVLGTRAGDALDATTVNWVTQASFLPPLVVVGVKKDSRTYALLREGRHFSLSVLESGQKELAFAFFKRTEVSGSRINGLPFELGPESRAPILSDALAWLEAKVRHLDETGDHAVVIAEVVNAGVKREGTPLTLRELGLFYGG